ncbi:MAG: hypothetical protein IPG50_12685 [Myxococcales bacterium]|nr:hypothetical protein [Myxococcales bacterium]
MKCPVSALAGALVVSGATLLSSDANAVGTRTFELDTLEELSGGDLKGVAVASDGTVRVGWSFGTVSLEQSTASFSALPLSDGSVLVGTSPNGKIWKVSGDRATLFADTGALAVTSMLEGAGGVIYAASMPDGKIFKIAGGKVDVLAKLDASHVWALAWDKNQSALFAATGPGGKVFRVDLAGGAQVYWKSDEPHIVSLATDGTDLFAGSSGKGILYRVTGPGRATVLYDFPGEEVKAIAVGKGQIYAIGNDYGEPPEAPSRGGKAPASPQPTTSRPKPGKGLLVRFDAQGRPERLMDHKDTHYMALALEGDRAFVGTGAEGRVYAVDGDHAVALVADADERQIGAIAFAKGTPVFAGGDPAAFHRVTAQGGDGAVWTSKSFDAGLRAKFGRLSWTASGPLDLSTRTGNTQTPDSTWSDWSAALAQPGAVTSPPGRFVQVRARFARDPKSILAGVTLPFVTENVRPVLLDVSAAQKGVTRETKEGLTASGGDTPKRESVVRITWKVDNADNDALRYRLHYRREGQTLWRDVLRDGEVLTKAEYDWDTQALPEGKYRVRVEASDELSNPPEQTQKHSLESTSVFIDNTPPVIAGLTLDGRRLKLKVTDGLGPVARIEVAINGRLEWRPLGPADGLFDTAEESVDTDITGLVPAGPHIVTVRAFDAAGNVVMREIESR